MTSTPSFELRAETPNADTLVCGIAEYGLAGLTAADYLVDKLEFAPAGHVAASGVATLCPV
ncbi:hypothetical protein [Halosegnis sp.]|uniref:hypothetical protein n=1 Tax=Halosegnis sp. TaxID=2864959 RepID=UPI0035D4CB5B